MGLNQNIWLPNLKFTLQTIAITYPAHPNDVSKRKKFPKKIPKKGVLNFNWTYKIFLKHFNAGYPDPYRSHWGKIFFIYKGKKKTIYNFVCAKKTTKLKLKKIYKNIFNIKLKNKTIRAET